MLLVLAGLAYRGFYDLLRGPRHTEAVRGALQDGLRTLAPVKGDWRLVWGPATSRTPPDAFDSAAMYVVRHRQKPARYVVAIRGTNPIAATDWLFGDFQVATTVPWPHAPAADGAAVSASTALGLRRLQALRSPRVSYDPAVSAPIDRSPISREALERHQAGIAAAWSRLAAAPSGWREEHPVDPPPRLPAPGPADAALDLVGFLDEEARALAGPLDVTVTGHSKGGALAATVALWLAEEWAGRHRARIACHAFAAPTPGNAAFAERIDRVLGDAHHHLRNRHDVVTLAWQADELARIPDLYAPRRTVLAPLIPLIASRVAGLHYRHARAGMTTFAGTLDPARPFVAEFIHQHLDAYLAELGLLGEDLNARTLFF